MSQLAMSIVTVGVKLDGLDLALVDRCGMTCQTKGDGIIFLCQNHFILKKNTTFF